jgi:hypothetical protein
VNRRLRAALLILPGVAVCAAAVWGGLWYGARAVTPAELLQRIPTSGALLLYVDFDSLRHNGVLRLLEGRGISEEPEYRDFERQTGFDYKKDLKRALLAAAPTGKYLLVEGSFDWKRLRAYALSQNGRCDGALCRMPGGAPDRRISFFPVRSNLMALAVSDDDSAALRMSTAAGAPALAVPEAPLWAAIPGSILQSGENLPEETQIFARSMSHAESAVLSFVPDANGFAARLSVQCRTSRDAADLVTQLRATTAVLQKMFAAEHHQPNPADLTGVLTAGIFRSEGNHVYGSWPIQRVFIENLLGGKS